MYLRIALVCGLVGSALSACLCAPVSAPATKCDGDDDCTAGQHCDPVRQYCAWLDGSVIGDGSIDGAAHDGAQADLIASDAPGDGGGGSDTAPIDSAIADVSTGDLAATDGGLVDGTVTDSGLVDGATTESGATDGALSDLGPGLDVFVFDAGPECSSVQDCIALHGAACNGGSWSCPAGICIATCPSCTDSDGDGYGTGAAGVCAGFDCDDNDVDVHEGTGRSCYSGQSGTLGVGVCVAGIQNCTATGWSPCIGEVTPTGEACNNQDDDCVNGVDDGLGNFVCGSGYCRRAVAACVGGQVQQCVVGPPNSAVPLDNNCDGVDDNCNGVIDENCPTCVRVAPNGNDGQAAGNGNTTPFRTIQAAIQWAAADSSRPQQLCVAGAATCTGLAFYAEDVNMANGIDVNGSYERTTWTRCSNITTGIQPASGEGVKFGTAVTVRTGLDGFRIDRANTNTTAAVTVDGATNAVLSHLQIENTPSVVNSYGIDLKNNASAAIVVCSIYAGNGSAESIGIRSIGALPVISNNCPTLDANGRCISACSCGTANGSSRICGNYNGGGAVTYGIYLEDSPLALVQANAVCANDADVGAGIRIAGDGTGITLRANYVNAWGGATDSHGIWMEDCAGAAPWIVDNEYIAVAGDTDQTRVDAVRAIGDCHPVVDSNRLIAGGGEGGTSGTNGVHCGANASQVPSRCAVLGNLLIQGSQFGWPPTAVGVRCDNGSCVRVANNVIDGHGGVSVWGIWLQNSGGVVEQNAITGGCPASTGISAGVSVGVHVENSYARLDRNVISGSTCANSAPNATFVGVRMVNTVGPAETELVTNDIRGGGFNGNCDSFGLQIMVTGTPPPRGKGQITGNLLHAGVCQRATVVSETSHLADPRVFQGNFLDPAGATTLYNDEGGNALNSAAQVNALTDMLSGANY